MVIENRDAVVAGTKLTASYKKQQYACTVEAGADGKLAFVYDGKSYNSPSSAGTAVIGTAFYGWRFWTVEGGETQAPAKTKASRASTKAAPKTRTRKASAKPVVLQRHKDQTGLEEGQTRWVCNACLKNFTVFGSETPEACADGHRNDDAELTSPAATDEAE